MPTFPPREEAIQISPAQAKDSNEPSGGGRHRRQPNRVGYLCFLCRGGGLNQKSKQVKNDEAWDGPHDLKWDVLQASGRNCGRLSNRCRILIRDSWSASSRREKSLEPSSACAAPKPRAITFAVASIRGSCLSCSFSYRVMVMMVDESPVLPALRRISRPDSWLCL